MSQMDTDPYGELVSLFLTDGDVDVSEGAMLAVAAPSGSPATTSSGVATSARRAPADVLIEVAIVGHLPVMGGLWLTQYADHLGRQHGPVALVRFDRSQISFELLRAPGQRGVLDMIESFDEALEYLGSVARRWVVCPQGEAALDGPFPGDALTLLTGGDDAATVAAYRIVKSLAERWHHAGWPMPPVGLVVLGANDTRVAEVAEKLDRTTKAFLDVDLAVAAHFQRMDAIESAGRRTFAASATSIDDLCRRIHAVARRPRHRTVDSATDGPRSPSRGVPRLTPKGLRTGADAVTRVPPPALRGPATEPAPDAVAETVMPTAASAPAPVHATPTAPTAVTAPSTSDMKQSLVSALAGLQALPIRCPIAPSVELAIDASGAMAIVAPVSAIGTLRAVEAWAIAHADLLRRACPQIITIDRVQAHLVTSDAPSVVPLHGTGVRLHLVIETPYGQVHAALN
ncbi:MAG: hypothetical protein JNM94_06610 [Phycisphaerae bacterium]|nr:hypothetical protein [Phycisphaerae bacterium]